jgi:hypothetical protein
MFGTKEEKVVKNLSKETPKRENIINTTNKKAGLHIKRPINEEVLQLVCLALQSLAQEVYLIPQEAEKEEVHLVVHENKATLLFVTS